MRLVVGRAMQGSRAIESRDAAVVLAGGVESLTRAPWVLPKPSRAVPAGNVTAVSTTLRWRLVNQRMPAKWMVSLGEVNELLADRCSISRARRDDFAARLHSLADAAWEAGFDDALVVPVEAVDLARDEGIPPGSAAEKPAGLKRSFRPDGTITPDNASPLNDGASAVLLGAEGAVPGLDPLARVAGRSTHALAPQDFGFAPVEAAGKALARAGITWAEVLAALEAFAVQSLASVDAWLGEGMVDPEIVNAKGGAIAIGHPLAALGGRILGTLAHRLRESGDRWGVAAIYIGVGQALAAVLENVS